MVYLLWDILCTQETRIYSHIRDWERFLWVQDIFQYCGLLGLEHAARLRDIWWDYWFDTKSIVCSGSLIIKS
jgi:hypothetical protein